MADIASLGIQVTTNGAQQATTDLNNMAAAGDKAAASTTKLGQASADAAKKYASPQYRQQADDLAKLAGQIDPTIAKLAALDAQEAKLAAFKKSGMLSADDFNSLSSAIDANRAKIGAAGEAMSGFSLNTSLARRELGRLASDAVNGNWGRFEQTSLTLANYSGLMSIAFSGVGAAIAAAVAAVGVAVVAFAKGQAETSAYNTALIQTGNIAGTTAGQLSDMAKAMTNGSTTVHAAADALTAVISTGKFAGDQLQTIAAAALDMQEATGQAVDKTVADFVKLADDPASAISKLNDQQHFLTLAIYDQIKALEDQGDAQGAAKLAEDTYAAALEDRTGKIKTNLGTLETAWDNVKSAAANAWDRMLDIGRAPSDDDKLGALQQQANKLAIAVQQMQQQGAPQSGWGSAIDDSAFQAQLSDLTAKRDAAIKAYHDEESAQNAAAQQAQQQAAVQSANDAGVALAQEAASYASAEVKRAAAIAKAHGDANDAIAKAQKVQDADLRAQLIAQAQANEQAIVAGIQSREKKPAAHKADPMASLNALRDKAYNQFDAAQQTADGGDSAQVKLYKDEVTQLQAIAAAGAKAIEGGASLAKVQAEVADAVTKTTAAFSLESDQLKAKNVAALAAYQAAIDDQIKAKQEQLDLQVASVGMGSKEAQQMQAIASIQEKSAATIEQLNRQRAQKGANVDLIDGQIAAQKAALPVLVKQQQDAYAQMDAAQADWKNGAVKAMQDYIDQAQNVAGLSASFFTSAFDSMGDALTTFVTTGKLNFTSLVTSILSDLAKMETRILASQILQSIIGSFAGSYGAAGTNTFNSSGFVSQVGGMTANAKGGVYDSPSLSAFSGQIVSKPTMFAFANGAGLMGEAGPEAILPLRRGPDGKLGIASGSSGGFAYSQTINIDNSGGATSQGSASQSNALAQQFGDRMKAQARQTIVEEQRPGGLLWRMQHA